MGSSAFGGTYAAPVWHDYMAVAHGSYCGDFPQPQNPVQFSNWTGSHAVSGRSSYSPGGTSGTSGSSTPPSTGSTTGKYPPQYYAPGAGQAPAPSPPHNNGGPPPGGGPPPNHGGGQGPP